MSTLPVVVTARNTSGLTTTRNAVITINDVAPVSLFTTQTPTLPNETDGAGSAGDYELGMRFSASVNGTITGIRYWKAASETGTHTGRIWSNAGTLLASVAFTNETASGWQTKALAAPINITAGAQYVVSVNVNARYAATTSGFNSAISNGGLTAPVGAGIFNTAPGSFPNASYSNTNYFRDVVFMPGAAAPLQPPVVSNGSFGLTVPASAGVVGTMTAENSPTSWAITAGNSAGYFSISSAGVISTTAAVVAGSYSLTVSATNAAGSGTGTASIVAAAVGARPGPTNTGYVNAPGYPGSLTAAPATIQSNTTYSFRRFSGGTWVGSQASPVSNVTFFGCRFDAVGAINVALFGDNITFNYCTFEPTNVTAPPVSYNQGYQYGISANGSYYTNVQKLTVTNCNMWGFGNGIDVNGSTQAKPHVFRNNWIHDPRDGGGIDHTDGLGSYSGTGSSHYVVIDNNVIEGIGNTNALGYQGGTYSNFTITNNLFGGFGYTMSIYANVTNLTFTDNVFSTRYNCAFGPMREQWTNYPGLVWKRNKWMVPSGAAWGVSSHNGWFWMPVGGSRSGTDDTKFVSQSDF